MERIKHTKLALLIGLIIVLFAGGLLLLLIQKEHNKVTAAKVAPKYWLELHRSSNKEYLYKGIPGIASQSTLVKSFTVKSGVPGEKPTPLPELVGRQYWLITKEIDSSENSETAPYFLELDVPVNEDIPYGPEPYLECDGQCNWQLSGAFGLHGVNGDETRLSSENAGSSGCVRHTDNDIKYLYQLLEPQKEPIRYYIKDI